MNGSAPRVEVHLLDPVPAFVVAKVLDGLRALGLDAELLGAARGRGAGPQVFLTTQHDDRIAPDRGTGVVALPADATTPRSDRSVADRVLAQVVAELRRLAPAG